MVRPTLEYASTVWDPFEEQDKSPLEMVQRRAARYAFGNYFETTPGVVTNMITQLGWNSLEERRRRNRLVMLYKIKHSLVGIDHESYLRNTDPRTRGQKLLQDQDFHRAMFYSFFPRTTSDWNQLPTSTTAAPTLEVFCSRLGGGNMPQPFVGNP